MADTKIKTQISRLSGAKSDLATAITAKGVTVPDDTTLDGYAALVEQIDTGVDTGDADATASDIAKGKTAYVNGSKVTGTLPVETNVSVQGEKYSTDAYWYFDDDATKSKAFVFSHQTDETFIFKTVMWFLR